ncbi:hypothetical protein MBLNU230_g3992t1 [Neophaeotheca triangularis]
MGDGQRNNPGFGDLFADNNNYEFDNLFATGNEQSLHNDPRWAVNGTQNPSVSRGQPPPTLPGWQQNGSNFSAGTTQSSFNGHFASYGRTTSGSPSPYAQNTFTNYGQQQQQQQQPPYQYNSHHYDPNLTAPAHPHQTYSKANTNNFPDYHIPPYHAATIAPRALEQQVPQGSRPQVSGPPHHNTVTHPVHPAQPAAAAPRPQLSVPIPVDQNALAAAVPQGTNNGPYSIIDYDQLAGPTNTVRMGPYANVGKHIGDWPINRAVLPNYVPRKSRATLKALAGSDKSVIAKLSKHSIKKDRNVAGVSKTARTQLGSYVVNANSPASVQQDEESSSEESSSDDDSLYSSDEEDEASPLPAKKPDSPKDLVVYNTIKALWRGKRKAVEGESIRKGMSDFWNIISEIRDIWKTDSAAATEAIEKKKSSAPTLQGRVKDQRGMLEWAFKTALKHGHRGIIELLGGSPSFPYLCYQFLLDRWKDDKDINSGLSRAILETMSLFTTLTDESLEKTHLGKLLVRFVAAGDAKTKYYANRIRANAAKASKEHASKTDTAKPQTTATKDKESKPTPPIAKPEKPQTTTGVKRAATTADEGNAQKKQATDEAVKTNGSTAAPARPTLKDMKKTVSTGANAQPTSTAATTAGKKVTAKPSGFFSSLQSAGKRPGTSLASKPASSGGTATTGKPAEKKAPPAKPAFSFTETMANLTKPKEEKPAPKAEKEEPPETPEEKAKRLRKESRRHLHVSFKTGEDLVEVRVFDHDPEEELGHDSSQVRDLSDVGGEGRMFKQQHSMMEVDEDEDAGAEKFLEFYTPTLIDFSNVGEDARNSNYAPYGGGVNQPEFKHKAALDEHETSTLMVHYTSNSEIPDNPKEPIEPYSGELPQPVTDFGKPPDELMRRHERITPPQQAAPVQQNGQPGGFDLSALLNNFQNQQQQTTQSQPQAPPNPLGNIQDILANLQKSSTPVQAQQQQSAPPASAPYGNQFPNLQMPPQPPQQTLSGQPDITAILRSLQTNPQYSQQQQQQAPAPQMGGNFQPNNVGLQDQDNNNSSNRKRARDPEPEEDIARKRIKNPLYKTRPCKLWKAGDCRHGTRCHFLHED